MDPVSLSSSKWVPLSKEEPIWRSEKRRKTMSQYWTWPVLLMKSQNQNWGDNPPLHLKNSHVKVWFPGGQVGMSSKGNHCYPSLSRQTAKKTHSRYTYANKPCHNASCPHTNQASSTACITFEENKWVNLKNTSMTSLRPCMTNWNETQN